ncbi:MAG: hypothetical protein KDD69_17960 [Bdellovibrionales bacterium]|nr:hypothetical protein [Bdellovibrionales bacterium]
MAGSLHQGIPIGGKEPMWLERLSDSDVLAQVAEGNGEALDELLLRYQSRLLAFLTALVEESGQVEQVFVGIIRAIRSGSYRAMQAPSVEALLCRLAVLEQPALQHSPESALRIEQVVEPHPDGRELLAGLVRKLPTEYRTAFILRDALGMSAADAAFVFGITEIEARARLRRARRMLRRSLLRSMQTTPTEKATDEFSLRAARPSELSAL